MLFDASVLAPSAPTVPTSVGVSILAAYVLDYAKRIEMVPWISYYTTKLNTLLRVILSGIGTLGVSWVWSPSGTGHQLLIMIPAFSVILAGLWHWATAFGVQHFAEIQLAQRPTAQAAMRAQQEEAPKQVAKPLAVPQA